MNVCVEQVVSADEASSVVAGTAAAGEPVAMETKGGSCTECEEYNRFISVDLERLCQNVSCLESIFSRTLDFALTQLVEHKLNSIQTPCRRAGSLFLHCFLSKREPNHTSYTHY